MTNRNGPFYDYELNPEEVQRYVDKIVEWAPEGWAKEDFPESTKDYRQDDDGDDETGAPFFSEAFLYNLLGKEDARTVRALLRHILKALGDADPSINLPRHW